MELLFTKIMVNPSEHPEASKLLIVVPPEAGVINRRLVDPLLYKGSVGLLKSFRGPAARVAEMLF